MPCLAALALVPLLVGAAPPGDAAGASGETAARLRADVEWLASDEMGGRDTGSPEIARVEEVIAARLLALGLQPLPGRASLFVEFPLQRDGFDASCSRGRITTSSGVMDLVPEIDWRPFDFSDEGGADGTEIVFAGYGITAPEHGWDDYQGLDVTGRTVLVLRHEPRETDPGSPFAGTESTSHATFTEKAANARRHGAAALIVVTDPLHHEASDDLRWGGALAPPPREPRAEVAPERPAGPSLPSVQVSRAVAERLARASGRTLAELQLLVDEGARPASLAGVLGRLSLQVGRRPLPERVVARNVVGLLPGSDPVLSAEWIVVGAHHDHVGQFAGEGDTIFNGADDDATGTSAVLELARRFATRSQRPRRSMLFCTFSAEEKGLHGSRFLVENVLPRERLAFMLNDDMLGRNPERPIEAVGDGWVSGLRAAVEDAATGLGLSLQFDGDGWFGSSDHEPFHDADVPFLFLFTGTHEDYHQVGDHAGKLDYSRMAKLVELQDRLLLRIAEADERPAFVHHVAWLGAKAEERATPDGVRRAVLTAVEEGLRGARQGLREGDAVLSVAGAELASPSAVGRAFRAVPPGSDATLVVLRDGRRVELPIRRAKPGRLGVFPGALERAEQQKLGLREDEGLVLRTVVEGGPASKAGLRDGDVLVRLAGRPVNQRLLQGLLDQIGAGETVTASVLRGGSVVELPLTLGER